MAICRRQMAFRRRASALLLVLHVSRLLSVWPFFLQRPSAFRGSRRKEVLAGEVGLAGEVDSQPSQTGFVTGGGDVGHVDLAASK